MGPRRTKGKLEEKQIGDGEAKMGKYSQGTHSVVAFALWRRRAAA